MSLLIWISQHNQAARIEKSLESAGSIIREESNAPKDLLQSNVDNQETSSEDLEKDNYEFNDTISPRNLHSTNSQVLEENETPAEVKNIFQAAKLDSIEHVLDIVTASRFFYDLLFKLFLDSSPWIFPCSFIRWLSIACLSDNLVT